MVELSQPISTLIPHHQSLQQSLWIGITWESYASIFFTRKRFTIMLFSLQAGSQSPQDSPWCLSDQNSIYWTTQGTLSSREEQVFLPHIHSTARSLHINVSHPYTHPTTMKLPVHSPGMETRTIPSSTYFHLPNRRMEPGHSWSLLPSKRQ